MSITIQDESRQRIRVPFEIDYMGPRYKTNSGVYTFTSPSLWTIQKNLFFLVSNSVLIEFNPKYRMRPDYLSFDEYGTVALWYMLMYVNSVYSIEDFDLNNVILPSIEAVVAICKDKFSKLDVSEIEGVNL
jgi:hypothetical protein